MKFYKIDRQTDKRITKFNLEFVISQVIQTEKGSNIGCIHLKPGSVIGYHQTVVPQLTSSRHGAEGYIRGEKDEHFKVRAGDTIFWTKEEWHETKAGGGLTDIEIEELDPSIDMTEI
ncbi:MULTISPECIES: cupin [unclassified Exiguobacterium]|uniref:cupin n=1 Tax=unclassified Exiguobacterium TaxID=2644629 RepID=UPI001BEBC5AC|nr:MULTISPECIES: cupin [unclassified Exiguobacterium]